MKRSASRHVHTTCKEQSKPVELLFASDSREHDTTESALRCTLPKPAKSTREKYVFRPRVAYRIELLAAGLPDAPARMGARPRARNRCGWPPRRPHCGSVAPPYKRRVGLAGMCTAGSLDDTALAPARWQRPGNAGPLLWEGASACTFSRRMAALGIAYWSDMACTATGTWLTWPQMQRRHGAKPGDHAAYNSLYSELTTKPGAAVRLTATRQAAQPIHTTVPTIARLHAARAAPTCMGAWEYLTEWSNGSRTWEPAATVRETRSSGDLASTQQRNAAMARLQTTPRPPDLRTRLLALATTRGGAAWLDALATGDGSDATARDAMGAAYQAMNAHASQAAADLGCDATGWNLRETPAAQGHRGPTWDPGKIQTLYRGIEIQTARPASAHNASQAAPRDPNKRRVGLTATDEIQPGELMRRATAADQHEARGDNSHDLLPPTRPDRLLATRTTTRARQPSARAYRLQRRARCHEIHEAVRILRAKSDLGVLCPPAATPMLSNEEIHALHAAATARLANPHMAPPTHTLRKAETRLRETKQRMENATTLSCGNPL